MVHGGCKPTNFPKTVCIHLDSNLGNMGRTTSRLHGVSSKMVFPFQIAEMEPAGSGKSSFFCGGMFQSPLYIGKL